MEFKTERAAPLLARLMVATSMLRYLLSTLHCCNVKGISNSPLLRRVIKINKGRKILTYFMSWIKFFTSLHHLYIVTGKRMSLHSLLVVFS